MCKFPGHDSNGSSTCRRACVVAVVAVVALTLALVAGAACRRGETNRALDPANSLPFGHVDSPPEGAVVSAQIAVGGWAMDDRGVRDVRIYIDGHFVNAVKLNTDRPDVTKAFPQYARGTNLHGFTLPVQFDAPGPHTLLAQAVDTDGATRDIAVLKVTSQEK